MCWTFLPVTCHLSAHSPFSKNPFFCNHHPELNTLLLFHKRSTGSFVTFTLRYEKSSKGFLKGVDCIYVCYFDFLRNWHYLTFVLVHRKSREFAKVTDYCLKMRYWCLRMTNEQKNTICVYRNMMFLSIHVNRRFLFIKQIFLILVASGSINIENKKRREGTTLTGRTIDCKRAWNILLGNNRGSRVWINELKPLHKGRSKSNVNSI